MIRTPEQKKKIVHKTASYLAEGMNLHDSAVLAGISYSTACEWKKHSKAIRTVFLEAEILCKAGYVAVIRKAAGTTWSAAAWWLERKYPDEFAVKRTLEGINNVIITKGDESATTKAINEYLENAKEPINNKRHTATRDKEHKEGSVFI